METKDLITRISEITRNYIDNGWIFNPGTMGGSQGEMVRIDLFKDYEAGPITLRIALDKVYKDFDNYYRFTIERFERDYSTDKLDTLWNGSGIYILDEYYGIKEDGSIFYMGTEANIKAALYKHHDRWVYKTFDYPRTEVSSKYYDLIRSIVSRFDVPGWKRFNIKSVTRWKDESGSTNYIVNKPNGSYFRFYRNGSKIYYYTNN